MNIPPVKVYFSDEDIEILKKQIGEVLKSGMLTSAKYVEEFEKRFAKYIGVNHATAVSSGTSAIEIPMRIFGVNGKNVIVPTNTFFATPAAVLHAGGKVKFAEADERTLSIDPESIKENIDEKTSGVIVVHIGGIITPRMQEIKEICEDYNLFLFEDCAHAHGSSLNGQKAGTFGNAASFSFFPTKVMTSGEGGMIITNNKDTDKLARIFRNQGMSWEVGNINIEMGYNWRMSELHAAVGLSQLKHLDTFIEERTRIAKIYDKELKKISGIELLKLPKSVKCSYYKYIAYLKGLNREDVKKQLKEKYGVSLSGEVYDRPCHLQPVFKDIGYKEGDFPVAEDICQRHICLPIYATMTEEDANYVLDCIRKVIQ